MFIEVTRVYRTNDHEHDMLLNIHTIMKVEPCDIQEYGGNTRIVLDRVDEDDIRIIMYVRDTYLQVKLRIKGALNPPNRRTKS